MKKTRSALALCLTVLYFFTFIHFGAMAQVSVPSEWKSVQILGGGFVSGLIYSETQKDLLYARTDIGGAYRWDATTETWIPLTDHLSRSEQAYTGILSMATDPSDPNRVYMATGLYTQSWGATAAILASIDKGNTWQTTKLTIKLGGNEDGRSTGERLQVDPNLGNILYLGSSTDGLWKSLDYGASWNKVNTFPVTSSPIASGGISFVLFDKNSSTPGTATNTIYVGVLQLGTENLYRSIDGGNTWQAIPGQPTNFMPHHAALSADGMLYLTYSDGPGPNGVTAGDVMKLNTITGQWTSIRPDVGQGGFAGLALDPQKPGTIMVSTLDRWWPKDEVFRSTDGGQTWKPLLATSTFDHSLAPYAANSTPHWLGDLDLDPFNSDNAWFVTGYGIYGSKNITAADAGMSTHWAFMDKGIEETAALGLISPPTGAPLISVLGDIDGFKHDNLDISPTAGRLSPRYGTNTSIDFAELQPNYMVRTYNSASGKYGSYSTDGGNTWTAFANAPENASGGGNIAVSADASSIVWSPGGASSLYYSHDNGNTWEMSTGTTGGLIPVADRVNGQKFYIYDGANGKVLVSTDGGASFSVRATGLPTVAGWELWKANIQAVFGVEGDLWLTAPSGLFHSINSGVNFVKVTKVQDAVKVCFGKAATGKTYPAIYLSGKINNTDGLYRSDNGGTGWVRINDDQHQFGGVNVMTADRRTYGRVYIAGSGRGIIYGDSQPYDGPTEDPNITEVLFNENFGTWPAMEGGDAATYTGFSGLTQATYSGSNVYIQGWGGGNGYEGASGNATFLGKAPGEATPLVISDISISGYNNLNLSFGLAWQIWWGDPGIPNYRPTIEVKVDNGEWIQLSQTDSDYPTMDQEFKVIVMPIVDANGNKLTGDKLSIRLSAASNGANYRLDDLMVSGKKASVLVQNITVTTLENVPAIVSTGNTLQLLGTILPDNTTNKSITWTVAEGSEKATISSTGLLTAISDGIVTVRATTQDGSGVFGELAVTIVVKAQSITVATPDNIPAMVWPGSTLQLQALVLPENTTNKNVSWTIAEGSENATISSTGLLTAIANGIVIVRATAKDGTGVSNELSVKITDIIAGRTYVISARHSGKVLSVDNQKECTSIDVKQDRYTGSASQQWKLEEAGNDYYKLLVVLSGKSLTISKGSTKEGAKAEQATYVGGANQKWRIEETDSGYYKLIAVHSNKALTVSKGKTKDGADVEQANYAGLTYQQWKFDHPTSNGAGISVNVEQEEVEKRVTVYPNPITENTFKVSVVGFESETILLKIMSQTGDIVFESEVSQEHLVAITKPLKAGIYIVQVLGTQGVVTTKVIVK